jgi:hypothetical protein
MILENRKCTESLWRRHLEVKGGTYIPPESDCDLCAEKVEGGGCCVVDPRILKEKAAATSHTRSAQCVLDERERERETEERRNFRWNIPYF